MANELEALATALLRARKFDEIALALQRQGALDAYAPARGQEVGQIGVCFDLDDGDMVFPSYRQPGVALLRGVAAPDLLRNYSGEASMPWDWRGRGFAAYAIPVGSQLSHAVGYAWAGARRGEPSVSLVFFGDGAASQGEVHEAMNYAGRFKAPVVFVCENNGYALSLPFAKQTAAEGIHVRAAGYGFPGLVVSDDDIWHIRALTGTAVQRARDGEGPTLIEVRTNRLGPHTTSDDPGRYRSADEIRVGEERDALVNFRDQAIARGLDPFRLDELTQEVNAEFEALVDGFIRAREARI